MPEYKYIETTDLPSDINGSMGKLRVILLRVYHQNRTSEDGMKLLQKTLRKVLTEINNGKKNEVLTKDKQADEVRKTSKPKRAAKRTTKGTK